MPDASTQGATSASAKVPAHDESERDDEPGSTEALMASHVEQHSSKPARPSCYNVNDYIHGIRAQAAALAAGHDTWSMASGSESVRSGSTQSEQYQPSVSEQAFLEEQHQQSAQHRASGQWLVAPPQNLSTRQSVSANTASHVGDAPSEGAALDRTVHDNPAYVDDLASDANSMNEEATATAGRSKGKKGSTCKMQ